MNKILRTTIVCLLIPSFVFAQIPQYRANEPSVKQTDLSRVWNALNTEVGQQIITYIESTVGSINLEQAKSFITAQGEIGFVPIKSFSRVLAALCYRQLEDGSEYLFLITYNAAEKAVSFTFPSGQMYIMKSSGVEKSINPVFQFQEYDDLSNNVGINTNGIIIFILCSPVIAVVGIVFQILQQIFPELHCDMGYGYDLPSPFCLLLIWSILISVPLLPIYLYQNSNLEMISILYAVYLTGCIFSIVMVLV